jgi:glycosyltransferase involved in cell wall biosynthesis
MTPRVSVIIALHRYTDVARRCVETTLAQSGAEHEVLVVFDAHVEGLPEGVLAISTGSAVDTSPAQKRDLALAHARGEICAFIDDDAWPADDWLTRALERFDSDPTIAAVGGPGLTPTESSFAARAGGAFYESPLGAGSLRNRFVATGEVVDTDDWPAFNFFVRREALVSVGGWSSKLYGGEDTKLCLVLVEAGHRIVADPAVVVFHARRRIFLPHMRQVHNVGRHRGWFVRTYPGTSARPIYFAPSLAVLAAPVIAAWGLSGPPARRRAALAAAGAAWAAISAGAIRHGAAADVAAALPAVLAAGHGAYGAGFIEGILFTREIEAM